MVGFVDDDGAEIPVVELRQTLGAHQGLDAAHHHPVPGGQAALLGFLHRTGQASGPVQFVGRLFQQFAPVGQD